MAANTPLVGQYSAAYHFVASLSPDLTKPVPGFDSKDADGNRSLKQDLDVVVNKLDAAKKVDPVVIKLVPDHGGYAELVQQFEGVIAQKASAGVSELRAVIVDTEDQPINLTVPNFVSPSAGNGGHFKLLACIVRRANSYVCYSRLADGWYLYDENGERVPCRTPNVIPLEVHKAGRRFLFVSDACNSFKQTPGPFRGRCSVNCETLDQMLVAPLHAISVLERYFSNTFKDTAFGQFLCSLYTAPSSRLSFPGNDGASVALTPALAANIVDVAARHSVHDAFRRMAEADHLKQLFQLTCGGGHVTSCLATFEDVKNVTSSSYCVAVTGDHRGAPNWVPFAAEGTICSGVRVRLFALVICRRGVNDDWTCYCSEPMSDWWWKCTNNSVELMGSVGPSANEIAAASVALYYNANPTQPLAVVRFINKIDRCERYSLLLPVPAAFGRAVVIGDDGKQETLQDEWVVAGNYYPVAGDTLFDRAQRVNVIFEFDYNGQSTFVYGFVTYRDGVYSIDGASPSSREVIIQRRWKDLKAIHPIEQCIEGSKKKAMWLWLECEIAVGTCRALQLASLTATQNAELNVSFDNGESKSLTTAEVLCIITDNTAQHMTALDSLFGSRVISVVNALAAVVACICAAYAISSECGKLRSDRLPFDASVLIASGLLAALCVFRLVVERCQCCECFRKEFKLTSRINFFEIAAGILTLGLAIVVGIELSLYGDVGAKCVASLSTTVAVATMAFLLNAGHVGFFLWRKHNQYLRIVPRPLGGRQGGGGSVISIHAAKARLVNFVKGKISFSQTAEIGIAVFNFVGFAINVAILIVFFTATAKRYVDVYKDTVNTTATVAAKDKPDPAAVSFGTATQIVISCLAGAVTSFAHGCVALAHVVRGGEPMSAAGSTTMTLLETLPASLGVGSAGIHAASLMLGLGNLIALRTDEAESEKKLAHDYLATLWALLIAVALWQQITHRIFTARTKALHQDAAADTTTTATTEAQTAVAMVSDSLEASRNAIQQLPKESTDKNIAEIQNQFTKIKGKGDVLRASAERVFEVVAALMSDPTPTNVNDAISRVEAAGREVSSIIADVNGLVVLCRKWTADQAKSHDSLSGHVSLLTTRLDQLLDCLNRTEDTVGRVIKVMSAAKGVLATIAGVIGAS